MPRRKIKKAKNLIEPVSRFCVECGQRKHIDHFVKGLYGYWRICRICHGVLCSKAKRDSGRGKSYNLLGEGFVCCGGNLVQANSRCPKCGVPGQLYGKKREK